jgi:spore germination protein KC
MDPRILVDDDLKAQDNRRRYGKADIEQEKGQKSVKKIKIVLMAAVIVSSSIITAGCWNYREVDDLFIVAGAAVDKNENGLFEITVEAIQMSGGRDSKMLPKILMGEGKTVFEAVRNTISVSGNRLYWSHSNVIILGKGIAYEGVSKVLEWYSRDNETRVDVPVLISKEDSAKEILSGEATSENILSSTLGDSLKNEESLGKAPIADLLNLDIASKIKGASMVMPAIGLTEINGKKVPQIMGSAIIKNDKLVGFLDGEETFYLNFIRGELKRGVLVEEMRAKDEATLVSLEIFKNSTKVKLIVDQSKITANISINTNVAIDEINGPGDFLNEEGLKMLKQKAEASLKARIESLIKKVQTTYDADIFGFSTKLWEDKAKIYKEKADNWDEVFKTIQVNAKVKVAVENSAVLSKSLGKED